MASTAQIQVLHNLIQEFDNLDLEELKRTSLGESGSLVPAITERLHQIDITKDLALRYAYFVHDDHVREAHTNISSIYNIMLQQASFADVEFLSNKENFLQEIDTHIEDAKKWQPIFAAAGMLHRGLLDDDGIKLESDRALVELKSTATETLETIKVQSSQAIQEAKNLAEEIEARARRTASRISVEEAQIQFGEAVDNDAKRVKTWWIVASAALLIFICTPLMFMLWELPENATWPVALYHTLLRVLVLSALAGVATFALRMLRVHLHLAERNRHRVRVANSVESFVQSALEPAQRDLILARLVDSIIGFGNSGLVHNDGDDHPSPMSGDVLGRIVAAISSKDSS